MEVALNISNIQKKVLEKYKNRGNRIIGVILARYDISLVKKIINDCYIYWNYNTGKYLDIFWAGYGAYLNPDEQTHTKIILDFNNNVDRVYFDLEAFISIKNALNEELRHKYKDHVQLVLINCVNGKIDFDDAIQIDLEQNIDENYSTIREIIEWITDECRSTYDVVSLVKKLNKRDFVNKIKGITVTDAVNTALSTLGFLI